MKTPTLRRDPRSRPTRLACRSLLLLGSALATVTSANAATLTAAASKATLMWSEASSWKGGQVPQSTSDVVVDGGQTIVLNRAVHIGSLTVTNGRVICTNDVRHALVGINAEFISVNGPNARLECGTSASAQKVPVELILRGDTNTPHLDMHGSRLISAVNGGTISLHGEPRTSWLKLQNDASKGTKTLYLSEPPQNWRAGMSLVVAASGTEWSETETVVIASLETTPSGQTKVYLKEGLKFDHSGGQMNYKSGSTTHYVDTRASVGLLSNNIVIRGDAKYGQKGYRKGAQLMVMKHGPLVGRAQVANVTFKDVGAEGIKGQYPFHWHFAGDLEARDQYIKSSAIVDSFNRCVVVHGTNHAVVENNVCYNHVGHGYFLEDGNEEFNVIKNNVSLSALRPEPGRQVLASDSSESAAAVGPANFWFSNPNNTVEGNVAAGGEGTGFWYLLSTSEDFKGTATVKDAAGRSVSTKVAPRATDFGSFKNNTAHSVAIGYSSCPEGGGTSGYEPVGKRALLEDLTVHMTRRTGVWPCGHVPQTFKRLRLVDSGATGDRAAYVSPRPMLIQDSVFVANSRNARFNANQPDTSGGALARAAIGHYDQGTVFERVHFVGYSQGYQGVNSALVSLVGGATKMYGTRMSQVTFDPPQYAAYAGDVTKGDNAESPSRIGSVIFDTDGSLTGRPGYQLRPDHPLTTTQENCFASAKIQPNSFGEACPGRLVGVRVIEPDLPSSSKNAANRPVFDATPYYLFKRDANGNAVAKTLLKGPANTLAYYQAWVIEGKDFGIEFGAKTPPGDHFVVRFYDGQPGDEVYLELKNVSPNTRVAKTNAPAFRKVNSRAEMMASPENAWYAFNQAGVPTIKLKLTLPASDTPNVGKQVDVYLTTAK